MKGVVLARPCLWGLSLAPRRGWLRPAESVGLRDVGAADELACQSG